MCRPNVIYYGDNRLKTNYNKINYKEGDTSYKHTEVEHRFIMKQLGYDINNKVVHHKNGKNYDHNVINLCLLNNQSEHYNEHNMSKYMFKKGNKIGELSKGITFKKGLPKIKNNTLEFNMMCSRIRSEWCKNNKNILSKSSIMREKNNINSNHIRFGGIVKSIKHIGKKAVYDIVGVEDNNNFIGNGFVLGNTGKSSAAIMMAREWCRLLGIRFDPARHIAYNNADVMRKIDNLNKFEPIVADEAIRFASSAEWAKKENKELKKKLAQVRTKHLLYILCFPLKIYKLEKNYLESFVNYWCLTGDTKIITKDKFGSIRRTPIKNINNYFAKEILTYNIEKNIYEFKEYEKKIKTKKEAEIYELELVNGLKIKCTEDHPFLTQRGWVRLKDLTSIYEILCYNNLSINYRNIYIKVKLIKKLKQKEDVYDIIGVKDNHNFVANNMIVHNCDLFGRGVGAIYVKDRNPTMDSWRMNMFKNVGSYTEFTNVSKVEQLLKKHPNFWNIIKFPRPPEWLYTRYLKVREKNVYDDDNVFSNVSKEDIHRALLILALRDIMMHDTTLTMNRVLLHIKNEYDVPVTKGMIEGAIEDSKQLIIKVREESMSIKQ